MVERSTLMRDVLFFLKNDLLANISDPVEAKRSGNSEFVMTSYPQRQAVYPLVTIRITNIEARRPALYTTTMDFLITLEIRIWARNQKEKDSVYNEILERLINIQFSSNGSRDNDLHDFRVLSSIEVDEEGEGGIKSRILQCSYSFFNN